jgi:lipopolysaccharide export system protein LptA
MSRTSESIAILLAAIGMITAAHAERADRDKPVNLEADRVSMDDVKKVSVFEGNVQLSQGSLQIRTDKLVVTQDGEGFQTGIATSGPGGLAHFRQKREGKEEYVDGEAERIEHDGRAEKTQFYGRAHVKSGLDEVRGSYVAYDARTENYVVTSASTATASSAAPASNNRVRAVIQPKNTEARIPPTRPADVVPLKAAPDIGNSSAGK